MLAHAQKRKADTTNDGSSKLANNTAVAAGGSKLNPQAIALITRMNGAGQKANITSLEQAVGKRDDFNAMAYDILDDFFRYHALVISKPTSKQTNMGCVLTFVRKNNMNESEIAEMLEDWTKQPTGFNKMMRPLKNFTTIKAGGDFDSTGKLSKQMTDKHPLDALTNTMRFGISPVVDELKERKLIPITDTKFRESPPLIDFVEESFRRLTKSLHDMVAAIFNHPKLPIGFKSDPVARAFDKIKDERGWKQEGVGTNTKFVDSNGNDSDDKGKFGKRHPDVQALALRLFKQKFRVGLSNAEDKKNMPAAQENGGDGEDAGASAANQIFPWVEMTDGDLPGTATHFYAKRRTTRIDDETLAKEYDKTKIEEYRNSKIYAIQDKSKVFKTKEEYVDAKRRDDLLEFIALAGYAHVRQEYFNSDKTPFTLPEPVGEELEAITKAKQEGKTFKRQNAPNASLVSVDLSFSPYINSDAKMGMHIRYGSETKVNLRVFRRRLMEEYDIMQDYGVVRDINDMPPEYIEQSDIPALIEDSNIVEARLAQEEEEKRVKIQLEREQEAAKRKEARQAKMAPQSPEVTDTDDAGEQDSDHGGSPMQQEFEDL